MPNLRCCSSYQALRKSAIFCLTLGLLSTSTPTIGESADDAPLGSDNPAQVLAPSDGSTASEQDSAGDEPIVVELDIPPQLAAFLDEQKANSPQAPTAAVLDGDTASGAADANVGHPSLAVMPRVPPRQSLRSRRSPYLKAPQRPKTC